jgi:nuclear transport factor 2 (NTF2) superfamily protein
MRATHFVESYFDAWNHRDAQAVADHLQANGTYRDIPENVERSQDELTASLRSFFSNYRHRYRLIGELITGRNTIAFQYEACSSELNGCEGFPIRYRGAEFVTL